MSSYSLILRLCVNGNSLAQYTSSFSIYVLMIYAACSLLPCPITWHGRVSPKVTNLFRTPCPWPGLSFYLDENSSTSSHKKVFILFLGSSSTVSILLKLYSNSQARRQLSPIAFCKNLLTSSCRTTLIVPELLLFFQISLFLPLALRFSISSVHKHHKDTVLKMHSMSILWAPFFIFWISWPQQGPRSLLFHL